MDDDNDHCSLSYGHRQTGKQAVTNNSGLSHSVTLLFLKVYVKKPRVDLCEGNLLVQRKDGAVTTNSAIGLSHIRGLTQF